MTTGPKGHAEALAAFGLREVRVAGFRSARSVSFRPGAVCALVGEGGVGKSNLLAAISTLLEPVALPLAREDAWRGGGSDIRFATTLASGHAVSLRSRPSRRRSARRRPMRRGSPPACGRRAPNQRRRRPRRGARRGARGTLSRGPERGRAARRGAEALPAAAGRQRDLYRLLREFAAGGNQVVHSTHAPAFLNVGRLDVLALVEHDREAGTTIVQPERYRQTRASAPPASSTPSTANSSSRGPRSSSRRDGEARLSVPLPCDRARPRPRGDLDR